MAVEDEEAQSLCQRAKSPTARGRASHACFSHELTLTLPEHSPVLCARAPELSSQPPALASPARHPPTTHLPVRRPELKPCTQPTSNPPSSTNPPGAHHRRVQHPLASLFPRRSPSFVIGSRRGRVGPSPQPATRRYLQRARSQVLDDERNRERGHKVIWLCARSQWPPRRCRARPARWSRWQRPHALVTLLLQSRTRNPRALQENRQCSMKGRSRPGRGATLARGEGTLDSTAEIGRAHV